MKLISKIAGALASLLLLFFLCNLLRFSLACDPIRFPRIDQAHKISKGGGTIVAIVDHGFDLRSKELAPFYFRPATFGQDRGERYFGSGHGQPRLASKRAHPGTGIRP